VHRDAPQGRVQLAVDDAGAGYASLRHIHSRIIAECVETEAEVDALRRLGIEFGQGFLFGEPKPVDALPLA
jgi:EAL domain-containing protein (putative c-di-GMP-specific phosphodiesterase class I)